MSTHHKNQLLNTSMRLPLLQKKFWFAAIFSASSLCLTGCGTIFGGTANSAAPVVDHYNNYIPTTSEQGGERNYSAEPRKVTVPDSSFFTGRATPVSHEALDSEWVQQQNPNSYTIEVASDEKPAAVADVLQQIPKLARTAQIQQDNKYTGVYGSYSSQEEAQSAFNKLPANIRRKAKIKQWEHVRSVTKQEPHPEDKADNTMNKTDGAKP